MLEKQEIIERLLKLQEIDLRKFNIQNELDDIPKKAKVIREELDILKNELDEAKANTNELEILIKNLELDIGTRKDTINKLKKQQFETRKNEEFKAIGDDIVRYEHEIENLENDEINFMQDLESSKEILANKKSAFESKREEAVETITKLKEFKENCEKNIKNLTQERGKFTDGIDEIFLSIYERLINAKKSAVVVMVDNGFCTGCNMNVTSTTMQSLKSNKPLTNCEVCGRIVYL